MNMLSRQPAEIGPIKMRNRIIMGSMHMGLEEHETLDELAMFYAERAQGGAGLIITGGIAPNTEGALVQGAAGMIDQSDVERHKTVTQAVHQAGGRIALQILHAGRYAVNPDLVAPSAIKSPITPFVPREMTTADVQKTIQDFANAAQLAKEAGYDGVEIMGSEGYLINQFLALRTNQRDDEWGGSYDNRMRFAVEICRAVRAAVGSEFGIIFRLSLLDLVEDGSNWQEVVTLAHALERVGVDAINSGFGWHEARIPTIAASVPPAPFLDYSAAIKAELNIPVIAANRFFEPQQIERAIMDGHADFVAMARPFLADPEFVNKSATPENIMPCIACNQACLDNIFVGKSASCLVNPRAGHEAAMPMTPANSPKKIAVIGAGPAGLSAAILLRQRGHHVDLFEKSGEIGGQLKLAAKIPGKEDFQRLLKYYKAQLKQYQIQIHASNPDVASLTDYDEVIIATGVIPRKTDMEVKAGAKMRAYDDLLNHGSDASKIAIMGSGPIGFDVASFLLDEPDQSLDEWRAEWGVGTPGQARAGIIDADEPEKHDRELTMLQRSKSRFGRSLGKTTGWIHRARLQKEGVQMLGGAEYQYADANGLMVNIDQEPQEIPADEIVMCIGQESETNLYDQMIEQGLTPHLIGGARDARGVDAERAIREAVELALGL